MQIFITYLTKIYLQYSINFMNVNHIKLIFLMTIINDVTFHIIIINLNHIFVSIKIVFIHCSF